MNNLLRLIKYFFVSIATIFLFILFIAFLPKKHFNDDYVLVVKKGEGISSVLKNLSENNIIYNYYIASFFAKSLNVNKYIREGFIHLGSNDSIYEILLKIKKGPKKIFVKIIEGKTFLDIKNYLDNLPVIVHTSLNLGVKDIEKLIDSEFKYKSMEGFLYPATYNFYEGVNDIDIYKRAYKLMSVNLDNCWNNKDKNLPYKNKYELLIMASLIEKETANISDMGNIAAVFVNRMKKNMLLQSDPTVIYALGKNYKGRLYKKDLLVNSLYNTYKYKGLPPSAIAIPSAKALYFAIHPSDVQYLFFVSKLDGTGGSFFSNNLKDHINAIKKYILKK